MTEPTKQPAKLVKVKLNQAHTHRGQPCKKDDTIDVRPHTAEYLEKKKIGTRV